MNQPKTRRILLIVAGGIAAYKSLELVRRLREQGFQIRAILTEGGAQFVTPLALASLTEGKVYQDLFSLTDENEMGHIRLVRDCDAIVIAPASANLIAKMAHGLADDLASTALLAAEKSILLAPAMNPSMWAHPATQANLALLEARGIRRIGPMEGEMACGESGRGRMAEPAQIVHAVLSLLSQGQTLQGYRALVTSGPTHEPIDPVRYLANRSSGKQGHAIAAALARAGAETLLISGPTGEPDPPLVTTRHIETAQEMYEAVMQTLPCDIAICAAAIADWRVAESHAQKLKKRPGTTQVELALTLNPDILAALSRAGSKRPRLVVGFAAETETLRDAARDKRQKKGCDWILANDVSDGVFGEDTTHLHWLTADAHEDWGAMRKSDAAERLIGKIIGYFSSLRTV